MSNLIEILKYATRYEHPIVFGIISGIIAFFLLRKFKDSEFEKGSKQNLEELRIKYEIEKNENSELKKQILEINNEVSQLRIDIEILLSNKTDEN